MSDLPQNESGAAPPVDRSSRRPMWRRVIKWSAFAFLVLLICLALLVTWLTQTGSGRAVLISQVEDALSGTVFAGRIEARELSGPVFGRLRLDDVTLTDDMQEFAASLDSVEMRYRVFPLLRSRLEIEQIAVEGLEVEGHIRPDGSLNLAALFVPGEPKPEDPDRRGFAVLIEEFELDARRVSIDDRRVGGELIVALDGLQTSGRFELHHDGAIDTHIDELGASIEFGLAMGRSFDARIEELAIDVDKRLMDFSVDRLTLGETGLFGFEGRIYRALDAPVPFEAVDVSIPELVISPEEIDAFVPGIPLTTSLEIDAAVNGPVSDVRLSATLSAQEQAVVAQMSIDLSDPIDPALRGRLSVSRFKPQRWLSIAGLTGELNAGIGVTVRGLTASSLSIDLQTDIQTSHLFGYRLDSGRLAMQYSNNQVTLQELRFAAGQTTLTGRGEAGLDGSADLELSLRSPELAELAPEGGDLPLPLRGGLEMDLSVAGELPEAAREEGGMASPTDILANVVPGFDVNLELRARNLESGDILVRRADVDLRGVRGDDPDLRLDVSGGDISVGGSEIENLELLARLDKERFSLEAGSTLLGDAEVQLALNGTWSTERVRARMTTLLLSYGDLQLRNSQPAGIDLRLGANGAPELVRVSELRLGGAGATLAADVRYEPSGGALSGDISVRFEDLSELAPISPELSGLAGQVALDAELSGSVERPRYDLRIEGSELAFDSYGPLSLRGRIVQDRRSLSLQGVEATYRGESILSAEGVLPVLPGFTATGPRINRSGEANAQISMGPAALGPLVEGIAELEPLELAGTVSAGVVLEGQADALTMTGTFELRDAGFAISESAGAPRIDDINASLGLYYDERASSQPFIAVNGMLRQGDQRWLNISGDVEAQWRRLLEGAASVEEVLREASGQLLFNVPQREVADIPTGLLPPNFPLSGSFGLRGRVSRLDDNAFAQVNLFGEDIAYEGNGPFDVEAILSSAQESNLTATLRGAQDGAELVRVNGTLQASFGKLLRRGVLGGDVLALRLEVPRRPLAELSIAGLPEELHDEELSGYLDAFGPLNELQMRTRFALREVLLTGGRAITSAAFSAELVDRSLDARLFICGPEGCALSLNAGVELPATPWEIALGEAGLDIAALPLQAELLAQDAPLEAMTPVALLSGVIGSTSGRLHADLRADGTVGEPELSGRLQLQEGRVEVVALAKTFENITLDVIAQGERIDLVELSLREGRGRLEASGYLRLGEPIERAELDLQLRNFHAADPSGAGVFVTSDVQVRALQQSDVLDVDVTLRDTLVVVPDSVGGTVSGGPTSLGDSIIFTEDGESLDEAIAAWQQRRQEEDEQREFSLPIDVHVRSANPVDVEHRFAEVELDVDLGLRLIDDEIETSGSVEVRSGYAQVIGKRFVVERGLVLFDGSREDPFDPRIRLEAVHRLPDRVARLLDPPSGQAPTISVLMDTYVSELEIDLRSDPAMSEDEILNVLLTGRPLDAEAGEGSALASAGNVLGGLIGDQLGDNVIVDDVSIEFDNTEDGAIRSRFEGGRYLDKNERIYAAIAFIAGAQSDESVTEVTLQFIILQLRRSSFRLELGFGGVSSGTVEFLYDLRLQRGWQLVR